MKPEGNERFLQKAEGGRGKTNELARNFFHQEGHKTVYFPQIFVAIEMEK